MIQCLPTALKCFTHRTCTGLGLLSEFSSLSLSVYAMSLCSAKVNNFQALDFFNMFYAKDPPEIPMDCLNLSSYLLFHLDSLLSKSHTKLERYLIRIKSDF